MKKEEIAEKLKEIIVDKIGLDYDEIEMDSNFINDLGCDSLDVVDLIIEVESVFNIHISDKEIENIKLVNEAVDCIYNKINS